MISTASVEEQEKMKQAFIKIAITTVSAAIGLALATATSGAAHPLIALATRADKGNCDTECKCTAKARINSTPKKQSHSRESALLSW